MLSNAAVCIIFLAVAKGSPTPKLPLQLQSSFSANQTEAPHKSTTVFETYHLRCDGSNLMEVNTPSSLFAIDNPRPRFTWAARHNQKGQQQAAYRLVVKEHRRDVAFDALPVVFDSGRVHSDQPHHKYSGTPKLHSDTLYVWRVTLWDVSGRQSATSMSSSFRFALADETDWTGVRWLAGNNKMNNNLLRSTFNVSDPGAVQVCHVGTNHLPCDRIFVFHRPTHSVHRALD